MTTETPVDPEPEQSASPRGEPSQTPEPAATGAATQSPAEPAGPPSETTPTPSVSPTAEDPETPVLAGLSATGRTLTAGVQQVTVKVGSAPKGARLTVPGITGPAVLHGSGAAAFTCSKAGSTLACTATRDIDSAVTLTLEIVQAKTVSGAVTLSANGDGLTASIGG